MQLANSQPQLVEYHNVHHKLFINEDHEAI